MQQSYPKLKRDFKRSLISESHSKIEHEGISNRQQIHQIPFLVSFFLHFRNFLKSVGDLFCLNLLG